jgi:hypothetical protein
MEIDLNRDQYPLLPLGNIMEFKDISDVILEEMLINQYQYLEHLGTNLIKDQVVNNIICEELLNFVNDNYLPIIHIDTIFESSKQTEVIAGFVYEFLCVDNVNIILPQLMIQNDLKDPFEICSINNDSFREFLFNTIKVRCDGLKKINELSSNVKIHREFVKWLFYSDLVDNQIELFIENFINPVVNKYDQELYSRVLTSS